MKNFLRRSSLMLPILFFACVMCLVTYGQDKKVEIDIGVDKEPVWYQQPWAWVLGAAIFILLLVALLRGGKKQ
jgi:preprotein translocase subunit SecG